jgi:hypothetical protein
MQSSVDEGNEFGLVIGAGLSEDLLKLTACRGYGYTHRPGGHLQPLTLRDCDRHLRFALINPAKLV